MIYGLKVVFSPQQRCGPPPSARFASGLELLMDGAELHLAYLRFLDTSRNMQGFDHPAFAALESEFANNLGGPSSGMPPDYRI